MGNESLSVAESRPLKEPLVHQSVTQSNYDTTRTIEPYPAYFQHSMLLDSYGNLSQDLQESLLEVFSKHSSGLVMTQKQMCSIIRQCYPNIKQKEDVSDRADYLLEKNGIQFADFKRYLQNVLLTPPGDEERMENSTSDSCEDTKDNTNSNGNAKSKSKTDENGKERKNATQSKNKNNEDEDDTSNTEQSMESQKKYRIMHEEDLSHEIMSDWKTSYHEINEPSVISDNDKTTTTTNTTFSTVTAISGGVLSHTNEVYTETERTNENENENELKEENNLKEQKNDREIRKYKTICLWEEKRIIDNTLKLTHIHDNDIILTKTQFLSYYRKACIDKPIMVRLELVAFGFVQFKNTVALDSSKILDTLAHKLQQERNQYVICTAEINRIQSAKSLEDCASSIQNFVQSRLDPLDNPQNLFRRGKPTKCCWI